MFGLYPEDDIICASTTPPGVGGISVIRVSGEGSSLIVKKIFPALPDNPESHRIYYGFIFEDASSNNKLDEVMVSYFANKRSFTGEETLEISCHGSPLIVSEILKTLVGLGIRMAQKGEFTYRAFSNGRIDLVQAESVLSLIESESKKGAKLALRQLEGDLSKEISQIKEALTLALAHLEANIDFSSEDIEIASKEEIINPLLVQKTTIENLLLGYQKGRIIQNGFRVGILGRPNAGKSSLLNKLIGLDKAIVTEVPGTTRDLVEGNISVDGYLVQLIDSAGIRESNDMVEQIGIKKSLGLIGECDFYLYLIDGAEGATEADLDILNKLNSGDCLVVITKSDLFEGRQKDYSGIQMRTTVISTKSDGTTHQVLDIIRENIISRGVEHSALISQARHYECLLAALDGIEQARVKLSNEDSPEFIILDLQQSLFHLYEMLGERFDDQVMDRVFSEFCLGK